MQGPGQGQGSLRTLSLHVEGYSLRELVWSVGGELTCSSLTWAKLVILGKAQGGRAGSQGDVGLSIGMYLRSAGGLVAKLCLTLVTPWTVAHYYSF